MARKKSFKVSFTLDESDAAHFRKLFREARRNAGEEDPDKVVKDVKALIERVRSSKRKVPRFVEDAISTLEDLIEMMEDEDYSLPKSERTRVIAALAYFANPEDLIPDHIPALGFLDDAIMVKFVEDESTALRDVMTALLALLACLLPPAPAPRALAQRCDARSMRSWPGSGRGAGNARTARPCCTWPSSTITSSTTSG